VTLTQIKQLVQKEADIRFGDTIERLFVTLRNRHTHQCGSYECYCEYCKFIRTDYVKAKLQLHKLKILSRRADENWDYNPRVGPLSLIQKIDGDVLNQRENVKRLKQYKNSLKENVI
jgi:hypothetical protein